ncbi:rhomboid family intramembrane serine protease GlpG [Vibrio metoecus]|uniref:Rhomboid family intramembrane serine protease GlpG n=1 Tax=Vibrio metoecus TaxID=1481663 RepID=A0A271VSE9_VIBMT|nr:rhomboid family intramembrane serine protease GlpG [Vibrio metoecus]KQB03186.1 intramembrane serine protease GlpG [Vibrio metoecus]KQB09853.1 intramembrane serine protease GlpG [Vibrio metoecus]PAR20887.1 rhomboid family intramembrane serine protease GlpG [Vibrio metoecus]PAR23638.1 rhomboid family intramembrane serine protease GlpG [Vibrio metoecus]PAR50625.1 rhomboid family intramembrane serine protease GlpG [Vibrio metoecus]
MQLLTTLNNPRAAQAFIDYMAAHKIEIQMMPDASGQFCLWVLHDQDIESAQAELQAFLQNPYHEKYQAASWEIADQKRPQFHYASPNLLSLIKAKAGVFTLLIMALCIIIFALQTFGAGEAIFSALHFPAQASQQWQIWRWVSHALLHFSVMHIAFNLLWWWQFGGDLEQRLGSVTLIKLFLVSAILSGAGQYWVEGANFGGLSGVVYALAGYLWIIGQRAPQLGLSLPRSLMGFMLIWLVLGYVQPFMAIANTAHLAGLISGVVLAWIDSKRYQQA